MNNELLLHLSLIPGIGPGTINHLMQQKHVRKPSDIRGLSVHELVRIYALTERTATLIYNGLRTRKYLEEELELLHKHHIQWITICDEQYPILLRQIYLPPVVLYYRGRLPHAHKTLACVGSRQADQYGQRVIKRLIPPLVHEGWHIISGGAVGIDTLAHQAALTGGGLTTAIIGSGLLRPYPTVNKALFEDIVTRGGCLISPFPVLTAPAPGNFPARNRIIAGMSTDCLVVQAAARSGALITASFALQAGRNVYAVPGPIDNELSEGCHRLIAQGATMASAVHDIEPRAFPSVVPMVKQASFKDPQTYKAVVREVDPVVKACEVPRIFDDLLTELGMNIEALNERLFTLQLEGKVVQNSLGMWQLP